ncbi:serine/threonine protein kinase [Adhaeretor mobilis]|uniref:Serine/threonine-protein kinase StkP n=1 Tax=Adhaeretor mobilis TaxID=1930276 RepID=A0A517N1J0_9BACT|nr:serine/threonine-protein kinase [Adhaeretor mobilis]QDT01006.1 Serine/threonine-protein kinase StkP [Adhaeretor mobilis]
MKKLRSRQRFGKYLIERKLGEGGFAVVYQARDTIEGVQVALKIPHEHMVDVDTLEAFRREVRLIAKLDHPNILPLKTADLIEGQLVVASLLGKGTLEERLTKRMSLDLALAFAKQMLAGVAYAHGEKILHCDIKPENFILFEGNHLRLSDFGVARVSRRTVQGSGAGTLGYMAPEQAMGRPTFQSDVFALGLVFYQMFTGYLPEWPFDWPPEGIEVLNEKLSPPMVAFLQRAMELSPKKRFADGKAMLSAFERIKVRVKRAKRSTRTGTGRRPNTTDWRAMRYKQFLAEFKSLKATHTCVACQGPVAESMTGCPWCGKPRWQHPGETDMPQCCPRCRRGMKLDWEYCPWCYGPGFEVTTSREYTDRRYSGRCQNTKCTRKVLMPFMSYCPWCHIKVRKKWPLESSVSPTKHRCGKCGWGIAKDYWSHCPWCSHRLAEK